MTIHDMLCKSIEARVLAVPFRAKIEKHFALHTNLLSSKLTILTPAEIAILAKMSIALPRQEHALQLALDSLPSATRKKYVGVLQEKSRSNPSSAIDRFLQTFIVRMASRSVSRELAVIDYLELAQLVVTERELVQKLIPARSSDAESIPRIENIGMVTGDRPDMLRRSAPRFASLFAGHYERWRLLIVDDSRSEGNQQANLATSSKISTEYPNHVFFVGCAKRAKFIELLSKHSELPMSTLKFGLANEHKMRTVGSARNVAHLLNAGNMAMFSDDDTLPEYVCGQKDPGNSYRISSMPPRYDTVAYCDRSTWSRQKGYDPTIDIITEHERTLGHSLTGLSLDACMFSLGVCDQHLIGNLLEGGCRVGICTGGVWGDCGMWSSAGFILSGALGDIDHVSTEEMYIQLRDSRYIFHRTAGRELTTYPTFQSMSYSIDLRYLNVPFFPIGRNSDGIFSSILHKTQPNLLFSHVPFSVTHDPTDCRSYQLSLLDALCTIRIADWLLLIVGAMNLPANIPEGAAILTLGEQLKGVLQMDRKKFMGHLRSQFLRQLESHAFKVKLITSNSALSKSHRRDLDQIASALEGASITDEQLVPYELRGLSLDDAYTFMTHALMSYADLLRSWPIIVEATIDLLKSDRYKIWN